MTQTDPNLAKIQALISQKDALDGRTDLTAEQKSEAARKLRKQIRALGGSVRTGGLREDVPLKDRVPRTVKGTLPEQPSGPPETPEQIAARKEKLEELNSTARRRARRLKETEPDRDWVKQPAQFEAFVLDVTSTLQAPREKGGFGVQLVTEEILRDGFVYGIDLTQAFNTACTTQELVEKFRARWNNRDPQYMMIDHAKKGQIPMLLLGPLPAAMVNR